MPTGRISPGSTIGNFPAAAASSISASISLTSRSGCSAHRKSKTSRVVFSLTENLSSASVLADQVEDYTVARLDLDSGAVVQIGCSWKLHAGQDAIISGTFYGADGGAAFHNVDGSFYKFAAEKFTGTKRALLAATNEEWGGRAAVDWVQGLAISPEYDSEIEGLITVAETL